MNHYNCIYMYTNKINGKRYIGQTKDFELRHKQHLGLKKTKEILIDKKIKQYGIENFEIKILAENISSQEKMNEYEKFFIERYNTLVKNGKGYNIADGGYSNPYAGKTEKQMEEIKKKMRDNHADFKGKNHPNYGKQMSEEQKEKLSNFHCIPVAQYDLDGNLIKIWKGARIAERELNIRDITKCCKFWEMNCDKKEWFKKYKRRPIKTVNGFVWKYYKEGDKNE